MPRTFLEMATRQSPPSEGPAPGSADDGVSDNIAEVVAACVFAILLAVVPVGIRLVFRSTSKLGWKLDDYTIIVAAVFSVANAAVYLASLRHGLGRRMTTLSPEDVTTFFQLAYATFLLYAIAVTFVKFSVLALYDRIFTRTFFKWWLLSLAVASLAWGVVMVFASIFQCTPVEAAWTTQGDCNNYLFIYITMQTLNIALDIAIIILPIRAVIKLQMAKASKISVLGTFALGGLSIVFAIIRLAFLVRDRQQDDITFEIATSVWSLIEPAFEVFCACLPTMSPLTRLGRRMVERSGGWFPRSRGDRSKKAPVPPPTKKEMSNTRSSMSLSGQREMNDTHSHIASSGQGVNNAHINVSMPSRHPPSRESKAEHGVPQHTQETDIYQTRHEDDFEVHPTTGYYLASVGRDPSP